MHLFLCPNANVTRQIGPLLFHSDDDLITHQHVEAGCSLLQHPWQMAVL